MDKGCSMNFLLKSRKVQRFFDRRFAKAEETLSRKNLADNVRSKRPAVNWVHVPEMSDLRSFYTFHDQNCPDVASIATPAFWFSHFRGKYPLHLESDDLLAYQCREEEGGLRFRSDPVPGTWIYLVSRNLLPTSYAIEFDYTPHSVFKEQLQFDWAASSLAERHRFILTYNEYVRYQRLVHGFMLNDVDRAPCSLKLGEPSRIRLEIVEQTFVLVVNGRTVACWQDRGYKPRPSRGFLLFWNGPDARPMDFRISDFRYQTPQNLFGG